MPAVLMVIITRQRMRFVAVCTKSKFIGSISPNVMYIFLLIRLRPRPARPKITLKKMPVEAANCSVFTVSVAFYCFS